MTIPSEFGEFFVLLNAHRVEYAVVGGYAVAFYGAPRTITLTGTVNF